MNAAPTRLAAALKAWGEEIPAWIRAMAMEADRTSSRDVAQRCGISTGTVSELLHRKYKAETALMEQRVRAALMRDQVDCPVLGAIAGDRCLSAQGAPYTPTNPIKVALFRKCRNCEHRIGGRNDR